MEIVTRDQRYSEDVKNYVRNIVPGKFLLLHGVPFEVYHVSENSLYTQLGTYITRFNIDTICEFLLNGARVVENR